MGVMGRRRRRMDQSSGRAFILGGLGVIAVTLVLMGLAAGSTSIGSRGETMLIVGIPMGAISIIIGIAKSVKRPG